MPIAGESHPNGRCDADLMVRQVVAIVTENQSMETDIDIHLVP